VRLLVVQTAFLGDVVLTLPLLDLALATDGVEWVGVVTTPVGAELLRTQDAGWDVIEYDKRGRDRGPAAFLRLVRVLRGLDVDAALIPHRSFRSAFLARAAGIRERIGFDESGGRRFLTAIVPYRALQHEAERVASLLEALGGALPRGRVPLRLVPRAGDIAAVDRALAKAGIPEGGPFIVVAPGSSWPTKRWLPERFAESAEAIAARTGAGIVLAGTPEDRGVATAVAGSASSPPIDLTGTLGIGAWIALIARARLLLSNDSAAAHVAAAVGTPVVAVFGPTAPAQGFAPYTATARVVETDLACRPCGRHGAARCPLGTMACMKGVAVSAVVDAAAALLAPESRRQ
jgi:heptosyltransferase-2